MKRELDRWGPRVDETLEELLGRTASPDTLERWFGPPTYKYDREAFQRGFLDPIWELFDRGTNRWRSTLFLTLLDGFGFPAEEYLEYACVPELLHKGALVLDDIEDDADLRLHGPPIHEQFGLDVAINAGNFCYFFPQLVVMSNPADLGPRIRNQILADVTREMNNLHLGQTVDIYWQDRSGASVDLDEYRQTCACKTGCLFRLASRMATTIADASERTRRHLLRGAEELAIAFQITDDRLDAYHSIHGTKTFGKATGNDVIEGKVTPLVVHALAEADSSDRRELSRILTTDRPSSEDVETALRILVETDAIAFARECATEHAERARAAFSEVTALDDATGERLARFVDFAETGEW